MVLIQCLFSNTKSRFITFPCFVKLTNKLVSQTKVIIRSIYQQMVREEKFLPHFQSPTVAFNCLLVLTRFAVHNSKIIQRVGYSWMH